MQITDDTLHIIGISPRNSYFNPENIRFTLNRVMKEYRTAYILLADIPDISNYLAYGYSEENARRNALHVSEELKNTVYEICGREGYNCADRGLSSAQVRIINWAKEIEPNPFYHSERDNTWHLYEMNEKFRQDIRDAAAHSIHTRCLHNERAKKYIEKMGLEKAIDLAADYPLSEFAFLEAATKIFGGEKAEYIYHRHWPVYERYIDGCYGKARPNLRFRIVSTENCP